MVELTDRSIIVDGIEVTWEQLPNGKYKCNFRGVYYRNPNEVEYWTARITSNDFNIRKVKSFPILKLGFKEALMTAVKQRLMWDDIYNYNALITSQDESDIQEGYKNMEINTPDFNRNKRKGRIKKVKPVKREELNVAMDEYLKKGGTITKLKGYGKSDFPSEVDEFLMGE
jgi:hypothetical protein